MTLTSATGRSLERHIRDYFEIPSEKWQTAHQLKVADFVHQYDSPDCMVIIYYGGHGYIGKETRELKLSA